MNETLREKEELSRVDSENLRKARDEIATLRRKVDQHNELMAEKDRTAQVSLSSLQLLITFGAYLVPQILHDEINTLQLELSQIEERNQTLTKDNAKLLQRWLDAKQAEVNKMNEANAFYEDMQSRRQTTATTRTAPGNGHDDTVDVQSVSPDSASGKGEDTPEAESSTKKDGTPSPRETGVNLTPNG